MDSNTHTHLIIKRHINQDIIIDSTELLSVPIIPSNDALIRIKVRAISGPEMKYGPEVKLSFFAAKAIKIYRQELWDDVQEDHTNSANPDQQSSQTDSPPILLSWQQLQAYLEAITTTHKEQLEKVEAQLTQLRGE